MVIISELKPYGKSLLLENDTNLIVELNYHETINDSSNWDFPSYCSMNVNLFSIM